MPYTGGFTMNKDTLLNALNDYLLHIQLDPIGDITSKINAVVTCRNYVDTIDGDVVNADWIKSNCIIILPAIKVNPFVKTIFLKN